MLFTLVRFMSKYETEFIGSDMFTDPKAWPFRLA